MCDPHYVAHHCVLRRCSPPQEYLDCRDFERYQILERKICFYTVTRDHSEEFHVRPWGEKAWIQSACSIQVRCMASKA